MATSEGRSPSARAADIAVQRFALARRGYDQEEVRRYLTHVAGELERLQLELQRQRARGDLLERRSGAATDTAYARISERMVAAMRAVDEAAATLLSEARAQAQAELTRARDESARIVESARAEARETAARARMGPERRPTDRTGRRDRTDRANQVWGREQGPQVPPERAMDPADLARLWEERPWPVDLHSSGSSVEVNGHGQTSGEVGSAPDVSDLLDFQLGLDLFDDPDA